MNKMMKMGLSVVLTGIAMNGYSAVVSNLLADASFEALIAPEPNAGTTPWFTVGEASDTKVQASATYAVTGSNSVKIANNDAASVVQNTGIQVDSNMVYEASAWMRTSTPTGSHTDAPNLFIALFTSPTSDGTYTYRKTILPTTYNTAEDTWERYSGVLAGADLSDWDGEYIQVRFNKGDNGTSHWLYIDDVEFGESQVPDNLLIAWDTTAAVGGDYSSADITGKLYKGYALDATAGSTDFTFGTVPLATNVRSAFAVRTDTAAKATVTFSIENTSAKLLDLDSISFDYSGWFANDSPTNVTLSYAYGDLDMTNGTPIFTATGITATGKTGNYTDFDVSLTNLSDHVLAPGEKAAFKLVVSGAGNKYSNGAFDNIAILGAHFTISYEYWDSSWGVDLGSETDDYDNDGWDNLTEYGLGGNPTNGFINGWVPYVTNTVGGLLYLHGQHATDTSLTYYIETTDDLVSPAWTNSGYSVVGTNVTGFSHNWVTNSVLTDDPGKFIRLLIEK